MRRWTINELKNTDDLLFAISVLNERRNGLSNPNSPMSKKLSEAISTLENLREATQKEPVSVKNNRLASGYILLSSYATLTDEEAKALRDTDETPAAVLAIKKDFLLEWMKPEYTSLEAFLGDYTYDTIVSLSSEADLAGALAFEYRYGLDEPFLFGSSLDKDAVLAYTDFLSGRLQEKGHEEASKYLDCLFEF